MHLLSSKLGNFKPEEEENINRCMKNYDQARQHFVENIAGQIRAGRNSMHEVRLWPQPTRLGGYTSHGFRYEPRPLRNVESLLDRNLD